MVPDGIIYGGLVLGLLVIASGMGWLKRDRDDPLRWPLLVLIFLLVLAGGFLAFEDGRFGLPATMSVGLLVAGSALFGLLYNAAVARQSDNRRREEKRRDLRRALRAEIDDFVRELRWTASKRTPQKVEDAFAGDPGFVPFIVPLRRDWIYRTVLQQVEVLDDVQVDKVVQFYALQSKVRMMAEEMKKPQYSGLTTQRRMKVLLDLNRLEDELISFGDSALAALGDAQATARVNSISKTDQDRADPAGEG